MKKKSRPQPLEPTDTITSIFTARRDLLHGIKAAIAGSGFSVQEADLLVSLYGARELDWDDLEHDKEGYVPFNQLERFLVHSPSLLSRRISKLSGRKPPLLEVANADPSSGQHFNAKRVRITREGVNRIEPVWKRFEQMSSVLVRDIERELQEAHHKVNQMISQQMQSRRTGILDLVSGKS